MTVDFRNDLDDLVQEVAAINTGRANRVPVRHRPLPLGADADEMLHYEGADADEVLHYEAMAAISQLRERNKRTAARRSRHGKSIKRTL